VGDWTPEFCEAVRRGMLEQIRGLATSIDKRLGDHQAALERRLAEYREDTRSDIGELKAITVANRELLTGDGSPEHGLVWKLDAVRHDVRRLWASVRRRERAKARMRRLLIRVLQSRAAWKVIAAFAAGGAVAAAAAIWEMGSR